MFRILCNLQRVPGAIVQGELDVRAPNTGVRLCSTCVEKELRTGSCIAGSGRREARGSTSDLFLGWRTHRGMIVGTRVILTMKLGGHREDGCWPLFRQERELMEAGSTRLDNKTELGSQADREVPRGR